METWLEKSLSRVEFSAKNRPNGEEIASKQERGEIGGRLRERERPDLSSASSR